jgi:subtilisin family serine protease
LNNGAGVSAANVTVESTLAHLNSLVVNGSASEIEKLRNSSEVAMIEKEVFHPLPRPMKGLNFVKNLIPQVHLFSPRPAAGNGPVAPQANTLRLPMPWGIMAVRAPQSWPGSNQGRGSRVMILDTGMDVNHPLLRANFEKGQDFTSKPGADNRDITDLVGHGTHVAGTIAGVGLPTGFSGVAPQAKILMGRVCSEEGCSNIAVAQGIEWGIKEKVDVISMSLGGSQTTPGEQGAVAAAEQAGVTVVAASGNDGTPKVGFPAALPTVISVGAVDSSLARASFSQFGPELSVVAPGVDVISSVPLGSGRESVVLLTMNGGRERVPSVTFQGAKELPEPIDVEVVFAGFGRPEEMSKANVAGKYVLISRGENKIPEKITLAIQAKAAGVILFNNAPGLVHGALTRDGSVLPMPVVMVLQQTGQAMVERLRQGDHVMMSMTTAKTDYDSFDGTSMATPHVSGVVALIKAANKNLKPAEVKAILQKTAKKLGPNTHNEFGAGLVDAEAAVKAALGK